MNNEESLNCQRCDICLHHTRKLEAEIKHAENKDAHAKQNASLEGK